MRRFALPARIYRREPAAKPPRVRAPPNLLARRDQPARRHPLCLAPDVSLPAGVENTEENRRYYRQILFTTPGLGEYVSGAICYEETLFHKADDGTPFVELMKKQGIIPGIKVDKGVVDIAGERQRVGGGRRGSGAACPLRVCTC